MNQNSHLLQAFLRYQPSGLVVEQSLNWLCLGAVVWISPGLGHDVPPLKTPGNAGSLLKNTYRNRVFSPSQSTSKSNHLLLILSKIWLWTTIRSEKCSQLINLQPHIQIENLRDSYKQSVKWHYFALIKPLLTLDSSEHMICLICFNTEHCQFTKISLLSSTEKDDIP